MGATMLGLRIFRRRRVCRALEDGECCARCWQGLAEGSRGGWARCWGRWEIGVGETHFGNTLVHFFPRIVDTGHSDFFEPDPPTTHSPCRRSQGESKPTPKPPSTLNEHLRSTFKPEAHDRNPQGPDGTGSSTSPPRGSSARSASGTVHSPASGTNLRHHRRDDHGSATRAPGKDATKARSSPPDRTDRDHRRRKGRTTPSQVVLEIESGLDGDLDCGT